MENVYSQVKMFHFHEKLKALTEGRVTPPIHVRLKPINACNHRCFYCCYRSDSLYLGELMNEKDMIPHEKMREIVKDMADLGVRAVTFTGGGEPLIYPYFAETASLMLDKGIKIASLTNGSALSGEVAEVLAEGASWVRVSIDAADGETLAKTRNISPGEFDRIVHNIEEFADNKHADCELGINFIVTKLNCDSVYNFIKFMKEKGVNHVKVSECVVSTKGVDNNEYHKEHINKVLAQINRAEDELSNDTFKVVNKFHDFDDKYEKQYATCPFITFLNVIAADLTVYTCQDKAYTETGILGSLKDKPLAELWTSNEYKQALRTVNPSKICNHHCVQHGKNLAILDYMSSDKRHLEFV
ncbi:MAG: radical SAM protein [Pseudomonadota bacterium]